MTMCLKGFPAPQQWKEASIISIHKNVNKPECNYRGLSITSTNIKLYGRMMDLIEGEYQEQQEETQRFRHVNHAQTKYVV